MELQSRVVVINSTCLRVGGYSIVSQRVICSGIVNVFGAHVTPVSEDKKNEWISSAHF